MHKNFEDDFEAQYGLEESVRYSLVLFELDECAKEFKFWYEKIFVPENPNCSDFEFSITKDEGREKLEVLQYNPLFSVDSLTVLFNNYYIEKQNPRSILSKTRN